MRRLAFLACDETLPSDSRRRTDAHEHDAEVASLRPHLAGRDIDLVEVDWNDSTVDWADFDAAVIRTTWDYQHRPQRFLDTIERIADACPVWNPPSLVAWNLSKQYLRSIEDAGIPTVPTVWLDEPTIDGIEQVRRRFGSPDVVVKLQTGANSEGQHHYEAGSSVFRPPTQPVMVQPFMSSIRTEGEFSFVFIDGDFSHCVAKKPTGGDYRIQSSYGGVEQAHEPSTADLRAARIALAAVPDETLYARIDLVRDGTGDLVVMEIEVIEPYLYPTFGDDVGSRLAAAIDRRIR